MRPVLRALLALPLLAGLAACEEGAPPPPAPAFKEPFHLGAFEQRFGYSQAVKVGRTLYVSATMPVDAEGRLVGPGDLAAQLDACYGNLARTLAAHGAGFPDVVLERIYVTDMARFVELSDRRFAYYDRDALPALTLVEVQHLVDPAFMVAVELVVQLPEPKGTQAGTAAAG
jgi:enamine deaminase RidA (YjgF/YER057c/UK114 family)